MFVDLLFPITGHSLPTDHAYPLYAALSRRVPAFHDPLVPIRFTSITGAVGGAGRLLLNDRSMLRVRLPADQISIALPLAGHRLELGPDSVRVGVPSSAALNPAPVVTSHLVTLKNYTEWASFLTKAREELTALGVDGELAVPLIPTGPRSGQPTRRVVRVKGQKIVGFAVTLSGLTAVESMRVQESGLGGRKRLGCGFFIPVREEQQ